MSKKKLEEGSLGSQLNADVLSKLKSKQNEWKQQAAEREAQENSAGWKRGSAGKPTRVLKSFLMRVNSIGKLSKNKHSPEGCLFFPSL